MSLDNYLDKQRRKQAKKQIRRGKPYLAGEALEREIDRVLGVADSGKMDWITLIESGKSTSKYSTPESVYPKIAEVAKQFSLRQWVLYWFFKKKVLSIRASGRKKSDYLALLQETATKIKPLSKTEKIQALILFSNEVRGENLTTEQADLIITTKGL